MLPRRARGWPRNRTKTADVSYSINVGYDAATGLPDSLTYPVSTSGYRFKTKFEYGYGILKKISNFNAPTTVYWQLNAHDERGQPIDEQLGNGARIISGFDALTGLMLYRQTGTSAPYTNRQNLAFEWDLNGNLKKRIDGNQANLTEEFFYDALNRFDYSTLNGATNLDLALDAIGNITAKTSTTDPAENVGSYTYHATKKHAVISTSNGWSFGYDANGNMNSYKGNAIAWTSYNLPGTINGAGQSSQFWYGPNRNRWKQVATYPSGSETTIYVGGILEKVTVPTGTAYRHYVGAGSAKVVYTRWSSGSESTKYVTTDHLNSSTVVMDSAGATLVNLSFAAFGARRGAAWSGTPSAGDWTQISNATRQGYTGHEHLDNINIIHMNGRVFDPALGRFLSADPFMPSSLGSQAGNRFAYVGNQPLSLVDPSGYFPRMGNALKQWRGGPGALDAQEIAIFRGWQSWGGVRNVSDGLEGTHVGLLAHAWDMTARGNYSPTNLSIVASSGSVGRNFVNALAGQARLAGSPAVGSSSGGSAGETAIARGDGTFEFTTPVEASGARTNQSQAITSFQLQLLGSHQIPHFWKDRDRVNGDPIAQLALEVINGSTARGRLAHNRLQQYIEENNIDITMSQISEELALAHAQAVMSDMGADSFGVPGLLSPRQVADYHHSVFQNHGIPPSVFGGTISVWTVRFPSPGGGWVQPIFDANTYSRWWFVGWCTACDTVP